MRKQNLNNPSPDEHYKNHPMAGWVGYKDSAGEDIWKISSLPRSRKERLPTKTTTDGGKSSTSQRLMIASRRMSKNSSAFLLMLVVALIFPLVSSWNLPFMRLNAISTRREALKAGFSGASVLALTRPSAASAKNLPDSTGADLSKVGTVDALVPVVSLQKSLITIKTALEKDWEAVVKAKDTTPGEIPLEEKQFKAIFDAYSNPVSYKQKFVDQNSFLVYYSKGFDGPGRPSIESDLPEKQTLQYGARNEAWVAWDDFLAELRFARSNPNESSEVDLLLAITKAIGAIDEYLEQAPAEDVSDARALVRRQ